MKILSIDEQPIHALPYVNARGGGVVVREELPLLRGRVDALPGDLVALLVASDLQGVAPTRAAGGALSLLGVALCEALGALADEGLAPPLGQIGALLCGDLYAAPAGDVRGATGDARAVWDAFAREARFVAGVAGNHDLFSAPGQDARPARRRVVPGGAHLLDGQVVELGGLRIGGVSGIIGNTRKPNRRDSGAFLSLLGDVLDGAPDVLILHEGPDHHETGRRGNPEIRALLEATEDEVLVLCGHCHWSQPLAALAGGRQVLNADARAVLLTAG